MLSFPLVPPSCQTFSFDALLVLSHHSWSIALFCFLSILLLLPNALQLVCASGVWLYWCIFLHTITKSSQLFLASFHFCILFVLHTNAAQLSRCSTDIIIIMSLVVTSDQIASMSTGIISSLSVAVTCRVHALSETWLRAAFCCLYS